MDDGQALYRVRDMKRKIDKVTNINITVAQLREKIAASGGNTATDSIDKAFVHTVKQPKLAK